MVVKARSRTTRSGVLAVLPVVAVAPTLAGTAAAGANGDADAVRQAIESGRLRPASTDTSPATTPMSGLGLVTAPLGDGTESLRIDLPDSSAIGREVVVDGFSTYEGAAGLDTIVERNDESVSIYTIVDSPDAPTTYDFELERLDGFSVFHNEQLGVIFILDENEDIYGTIAPPWAVDANGSPVTARYTVEGNVVSLHVAHEGAQYPVIADPQYTWGIITGTAYFSRKETKNARTHLGASQILAGICLFYTPLAFPCFISGAVITLTKDQANNAWSENRCLKFKVPYMQPGTYPWGEHVCTDCPK